jgi:NAD(P)-dependent dehydrogenase (short-subunit alcohol dehydrogenase family)
MAAGAVVVTGASSGIGEATALHLNTLGFDVFAGVRKDEDAERLKVAGLTPLKLDVTDPDSIEAAASELRGPSGGRLAGLVNNAGIAVSGPLEFVPIDELRHQLEVNFVGQVAVTQAFLPLVRAARGRIVNVSSIGGRVALPLLGPYAASKFALEGVSDSLRRELRPLGVHVALVEPGGIKTPIWDKGNARAQEMMGGMPPEAEQLYGDLFRSVRQQARRIAAETGLPPRVVAEAIGHALTARRPKTRYVMGRDARARAIAARFLPDRVFDGLVARTLSR